MPQGHLGGSMDAYRPLSLSLAHKLTQLGTTLFDSNNIVLSLLRSVSSVFLSDTKGGLKQKHSNSAVVYCCRTSIYLSPSTP